MMPASVDFDCVWGSAISDTQVRASLDGVGRQRFRVQYTGGGGGMIERSVSERGLERWMVLAMSEETMLEIGGLLTRALAPLAQENDLKLDPVYQTYGDPSHVGWVLWHPREE